MIGLYTGYILTTYKSVSPTSITILGQFHPGDLSGPDYASPWAGANFSTVSGNSPASLRQDKATYQELERMVDRFGGEELGVKKLVAMEYFGVEEAMPSAEKLASLKEYIPDLEVLDREAILQTEHNTTMEHAIRFTTFNIFTPKFTAFLASHLQSKGVMFVRRKVEHIDEAFLSGSTRVVFNCTGLGSRVLGGVEDESVFPLRGQIVVVRAPHVAQNVCEVSTDLTYVIPRPYSDGHVVLGGYAQPNNFDTSVYGSESKSILERVKRLFPGIEPFEVLREASGLRPKRADGARIEREQRDKGVVIHNYGAGGNGFQTGYGMALEAVALLDSESE